MTIKIKINKNVYTHRKVISYLIFGISDQLLTISVNRRAYLST